MKTDCQHLHTVIQTTGSIRFVAGDIEDDTHDETICLDCGETLTVQPQPEPEFELAF